MKVELGIRRGGHAEQARIQGDEFIHRRADDVRDQPEIGGIVDGDGVCEHWRVEGDFIKAILAGVIGDDDGGEDFRDVVLGFARQVVALVELPEIGIAGFLDGALNVSGAPVVPSHGEIPVTELRVNVLHVAGIGAGGLLRIEALVDVAISLEAVISARHELPHAAGTRLAIDGPRLEAGFGDGKVDELSENGLMLGAFDFAQYANASTALGPDDQVLLYTDGLAEANNVADEEFGVARLKECFDGAASRSIEQLFSKTAAWTANVPQQDDLTAVVVVRR